MQDETRESDEETAIDWDAVEDAWCDPARKITEIAAEIGITRQRLAAEARKREWPPRLSMTPRGRTRAAKIFETAGRIGGAVRSGAMATRLKRLIESEIADVEREYRSGDAAMREGAAKRLNSLVRSLDKLRDIEASAKGTAADGRSVAEKIKARREEDEKVYADLQARFARAFAVHDAARAKRTAAALAAGLPLCAECGDAAATVKPEDIAAQ
ncbi:MAG: hypothetical protein Q7V31_06595 [Parvibaculum sp.]|uniref:hypothetical protein n=1 Tax=Parvibaculum sp. TaxID=2024848 RepID=UPI00271F334B|nr:hypothetical protein [Parvibaculum sp.]MDO8838582.1 hypothetical protein [Parvibaculum sp.]